ncbi:hypothetical protein OH76DRAFT_1419360 [Lentinus brumalis]|uniref:Uncharacterized protein n=1 Tax=Lentinus brumalis TaxID=2498619 RepID=A0A371D5X2_9APHY|nr:hypothetical protein OH76DRAFT_1419360 [Polyporus brumalis]
MVNNSRAVTGSQFVVAMSIFASKNEDRFGVTLDELLSMLHAIEFVDHPTIAGAVCPPRRFQNGPQGTDVLLYNPHNKPLGAKMTFKAQAEMKRELRTRYDLKLTDFIPRRVNEWEGPGDPQNPEPIPWDGPTVFDIE